ncbi:unnamed protein product, partial [Ectocarpus sp. 8 AP-2014]
MESEAFLLSLLACGISRYFPTVVRTAKLLDHACMAYIIYSTVGSMC